jgi:hypothetical protein
MNQTELPIPPYFNSQYRISFFFSLFEKNVACQKIAC